MTRHCSLAPHPYANSTRVAKRFMIATKIPGKDLGKNSLLPNKGGDEELNTHFSRQLSTQQQGERTPLRSPSLQGRSYDGGECLLGIAPRLPLDSLAQDKKESTERRSQDCAWTKNSHTQLPLQSHTRWIELSNLAQDG